MTALLMIARGTIIRTVISDNATGHGEGAGIVDRRSAPCRASIRKHEIGQAVRRSRSKVKAAGPPPLITVGTVAFPVIATLCVMVGKGSPSVMAFVTEIYLIISGVAFA